MTPHKFTIHTEPFSLNQYRNTHFYKLNTIKKRYSESIFYQLKSQGLKTIKTPCAIQLFFHWKRQNYDLDNQVITKFIFDTLQEMNVIPNDNVNHIVKLCLCKGERKDNTIDIYIHELN